MLNFNWYLWNSKQNIQPTHRNIWFCIQRWNLKSSNIKELIYIYMRPWNVLRNGDYWLADRPRCSPSTLGLNSLSGRTSHRKISPSLKADRSAIWQAPRQYHCRDACQIAERYYYHNILSRRGCETSRHLTVSKFIIGVDYRCNFG